MSRRILILQGHPDASEPHLCHALAQHYLEGAEATGHTVRVIDVGTLDFPLLRSRRAWENEPLPEALRESQTAIAWAEHLVLFFPLWLGDMPALFKGFLEQVARPGFAFAPGATSPFAAKGLSGRSARVVVTMGMPALVYEHFYRAHSVKSLERNVLGFVGIAPIEATLIGQVESLSERALRAWFERLHEMGRWAR
ncbi:NAD(P)H-dependent oxidoreductase [Modicisalibacter tunisiensis]|uniref:NAD(P)H-dependent oxidoreductase n=1 Tax=Modicisalibacter tunisiensis TaxID=390637 RepID=A0ABS7X162_9GAMM|nr:NAD(P)H-dependent oxidoreductase [Modicisalibacter tunisiensis]MBZ9537965.1 NAD(P)H-dependent oxidoreductase [Modicisalibacter tunisiensis]MBZ9568618.1 NAD(P)H-dependent oxidoreductase [Modicisalibacter tunisiensis]